MDGTDRKALDEVLDDLIENVVTFKGNGGEFSEDDIVGLMYSLDYAKFIVSGIIYSNGICICGEDHDEDTEE